MSCARHEKHHRVQEGGVYCVQRLFRGEAWRGEQNHTKKNHISLLSLHSPHGSIRFHQMGVEVSEAMKTTRRNMKEGSGVDPKE